MDLCTLLQTRWLLALMLGGSQSKMKNSCYWVGSSHVHVHVHSILFYSLPRQCKSKECSFFWNHNNRRCECTPMMLARIMHPFQPPPCYKHPTSLHALAILLTPSAFSCRKKLQTKPALWLRLERNMAELVGDAPFTATDENDATVKEVRCAVSAALRQH